MFDILSIPQDDLKKSLHNCKFLARTFSQRKINTWTRLRSIYASKNLTFLVYVFIFLANSTYKKFV